MNIHEYQAKELLAAAQIPVPPGHVGHQLADVERIATQLFEKEKATAVVVKAQIHAGGRGKGHIIHDGQTHGVAVVKNVTSAVDHARKLLGQKLITHQTGAHGQTVQKVLIECASQIERELYASLVVDRDCGWVTFLVSQQGGMDIEEVAQKDKNALFRLAIDPAYGFSAFHGRLLAQALDLKGPIAKESHIFFARLYQAFVHLDMSLLEINPLVCTAQKQLIALDAKVNFDDNALFRHPDIMALRDTTEEDSKEQAARDAGLSYVALEGSIGCLVNGAGLAMATMDIIKYCGGAPANFLDVGGGATAAQVTQAFKIILADVHVKAILVNIFGGIAKCDVIAEGILVAARDVQLQVPLVVRLEGTRVAEGKKLLNESKLTIIAADNMLDAAQKVVQAAKGNI